MQTVLLRTICPLMLALVMGGGNWPLVSVVVPVSSSIPSQPAVASPAPASAGTANRLCAYLGIVDGTRLIDPGFAVAPVPAPTSRKPASVPVATAAASVSGYCHPLPPLLRRQEGR